MDTLTLGVRPAKPDMHRALFAANDNELTPPTPVASLAQVRAAHVASINAAAKRAMWSREPESVGMPARLFAAGCYLAANGVNAEPCEGERWFATGFHAYRALASADTIEEGRKAIFDGRRALVALQPAQVAA